MLVPRPVARVASPRDAVLGAGRVIVLTLELGPLRNTPPPLPLVSDREGGW